MGKKPGKELDALIAEKVMGLAVEKFMINPPKPTGWVKLKLDTNSKSFELPKYSTDISAAWEVVEKFVPLSLDHTDGNWRCGIAKEGEVYHAGAESAPHAICIAALKAVGYED